MSEELSQVDEVITIEPEELEISFDDETPETETETDDANWATNLRHEYKELRKKNQALENQIKALESNDKSKPTELSKPALEDFDYDAEKYEEALINYLDQKKIKDNDIKNQQDLWNNKIQKYDSGKRSLNKQDFEDAENEINNKLSPQQIGMIVHISKQPAHLIYALSKSNKLDQLAKTTDLYEFAYTLAEIETKMKVTNMKKEPEKQIKSSASITGNNDKTLDRLRADAEKTGDYSKVMAYRRSHKK